MDVPPALDQTANMAINSYIQGHSSDTKKGMEWTAMPELPLKKELLDIEGTEDTVLLHPNQISDPWKSSQEYLEAHYKLLREDAVAPLRDAVAIFRQDPDMPDHKEFAVYEKVHIVRVTLAMSNIAFRIRFSTQRAGKKILWKYSSRLIAGTLLAMSPADDCFKTKCVVATVVARTIENVSEYPPEIDIYFADPEDIEIDSQKEWVMLESRMSYYEASRHTLTALQKLSKEQFPLSEHICQLNTNVPLSQAVLDHPTLDLQCLTGHSSEKGPSYNVLTELPPEPLGKLNDLQWQALKEMLTKKLVLVQGPPGTGKTHVSVVALQVLLSNMIAGEPPIIIAAHTNHALDQLLRLVASYEKSYIRLGGRSKDLEICQRTMYAIRNSQSRKVTTGSFLDQARKDQRTASSHIMEVFKPLENECSTIEPLTAATFVGYGLLSQAQLDSMARETSAWQGFSSEAQADPFKDWLGEQVTKFKPRYGDENMEFARDDVDGEYEQLQELEAEQGPDTEGWEGLRGRQASFEISFRGKERETVSESTIKQYLSCPDMFRIPVKHRGSVYNHLRGKLINIMRDGIRKMAVFYGEICKSVLVGRWQRDHEILRGAKLIAMTTTGLSKYRGLVASLNPKIVLIEEAAEVIEAPVAVAYFESIQQLILVGDHKQLQGHCALHDLAGPPFHLDVSMFERLVGNKMPFVMLREQRRMAPEISQLLEPIYGKLQDHASVREYPKIPGMGDTRSFFLDHNWPENGDSMFSKINETEATMVVELYTYLLLNGTPSKDITILTFYNGQRKFILKLLKSSTCLRQHTANVVTVDSYQGEENEIILASLVRSNRAKGIGFLAIDNRVCVALSRARRGFFLFGNKTSLSAVSPLWREVIDILGTGENKRIGDALTLTCQRHGSQTEVRVPGDWQLARINGSCDVPCGEKMKCGHICPQKCHGFGHSGVVCRETCSYVSPCCEEACSNTCGEFHIHRCDCAPVVSQAEVEHDKSVQEVLQDVRNAILADPLPRRSNHPFNQRGRGSWRGSNKLVRRGRVPVRHTVRVPAQGPVFPRNDDPDESRGKWAEFANGGGRTMDVNLGILSRAKDLNSEEAQRALAGIDNRFLTKEMLEAKEAFEGKKEGNRKTKGMLINLDSDEDDCMMPVLQDSPTASLNEAYEESSRIEELFEETEGSSHIEELNNEAEDDDEDQENPAADGPASGVPVGTLINFSD